MTLSAVMGALLVGLVVVGVLAPLVAWADRKQRAITAGAIGPNRADLAGVSAFGLLQPAADLLKLLAKEDVVPEGARPFLFRLAPIVAVVCALLVFAIVPFGGQYRFGNTHVNLVLADLDWGVLYVLALGSVATFAVTLAGLSSNDDWSLLGGLRGAAQTISVQVGLGLSLLGPLLVFGTLRLTDMSIAQDATVRLLAPLESLGLGPLPAWLAWLRVPAWGIVLQPLAFVLFFTSAIAAAWLPPFDQPEAPSEIGGGYLTEYSGVRFGLFRLAGVVQIVAVASLITATFLGGWSIPYLSQAGIIGVVAPWLGEGFATALCIGLHVTTFFVKVAGVIWLQILARWSLPRLRSDQVTSLAWKRIVPLALANAFATAALMLRMGAVR